MNLESNSSAQGTQPGKPGTAKRSRAHRNRPMLVTSTSHDTDTTEQSISETVSSKEPVQELAFVEENVPAARPRILPKFFSSVGKSEVTTEKQEAARLARATRHKATTTTSAPAKEKPKASPAPARPASRASVTQRPAARPGGFKTRYLMGMVLYLVIADVLGVVIQNYMKANNLDGLLFTLGPITVLRSTLLFLILLVVILVLLARFDLIPRSLGSMMNQPASQGRAGQTQRSSSENVKTPPPTMKQGVKGDDDDLYQEYRENQRYLQRRERKR